MLMRADIAEEMLTKNINMQHSRGLHMHTYTYTQIHKRQLHQH